MVSANAREMLISKQVPFERGCGWLAIDSAKLFLYILPFWINRLCSEG